MSLSPEQLKELSNDLDARQRELLEDVRVSLENSGNKEYLELFGQTPTDAGDASVSDMLADLNLTMIDRHITELRAIEAAHGRIKDGTYGECMEGGEDIPFARLKAYPTALRCVQHQEVFERTHAQQGMPTL
jgi:DnaK suppressor protein